MKRKHRLLYNLRPDQKQLGYKQDNMSRAAISLAFKELTTKACMHKSKKQTPHLTVIIHRPYKLGVPRTFWFYDRYSVNFNSSPTGSDQSFALYLLYIRLSFVIRTWRLQHQKHYICILFQTCPHAIQYSFCYPCHARLSHQHHKGHHTR